MNLDAVLVNGDNTLFESARDNWLDKLKPFEELFSTVGYHSYLAYIEQRLRNGWGAGTETYAIKCQDSEDAKAFFEISHVLPTLEGSYLKVLSIRMCPTLDGRVPDENKDLPEMDRLRMVSNIASRVLAETLSLAKNRGCSLVKILSTKQVDSEFFVSFADRIDKAEAEKLGFGVRTYSGGLWLEIQIL